MGVVGVVCEAAVDRFDRLGWMLTWSGVLWCAMECFE